jgi:Putative Flp pilus-assembly TadE/G-like
MNQTDARATRDERPADDERGQVLVIVAIAFTVLLMFLAVLFDGANGLVTRRQMQDAGDAAALAAANQVLVGTPHGCSSTADTTPRASVAQAAHDSLAANLTWYDASTAVITCPAGYDNFAVSVELWTQSKRFFGGIMGDELDVRSHSVAVNGQITGTRYSVLELDPWNASWPNGRRGCPSVLLSGGPTVTFEGSVQINSACPSGDGGALATNGNAANLSLLGTARLRTVGGYSPGSLTINPAPITGVLPAKDPLAGLTPVSTTGMTVRSNTRLILNNTMLILQPGVYRGGIELRNSSVAFLRPGIYVLEGGGLDIGAQAKVFSVGATALSTTAATWTSDCLAGSCGVLIYNKAGSSTPMGPISVAAGSTLLLRSYDPAAQSGGVAEYENLLLWQDALPVPTASYAQPVVSLNGGGLVDISGTVYAPSGKVEMGGNSGGSGGSSLNLTLQFISWDLEFRGNASFYFYFRDEDFARPTNYGLVE